MKHVSFANRNCSLARALDVVGEWWILPILQEAFFGTRKFGDFQKHLGIAKNILADRLDRLVSNGLLVRDSQTPKGKRAYYRLTEKGRSLAPTLVALIQWGDTWTRDTDSIPLRLVDRITGDSVAPVKIQTLSGQNLVVSDLMALPGPGANTKTRIRVYEKILKTSKIRVRIRKSKTD